jgi:hypothetical protein
VEAGGGDGAYDLFYDEPSDTPYEVYSDSPGERADEIRVRQRDGSLTPLARLSPLPQALGRQLMFRRLHVAPAWRDVVVAAVGDVGYTSRSLS